MDFTPVEFRKWKAQVSTFFKASNLQHASMKEQRASMKEQHGYLHMCLNANLTNHLNVNSTAATPVMTYTEDDDERKCMDIIAVSYTHLTLPTKA